MNFLSKGTDRKTELILLVVCLGFWSRILVHLHLLMRLEFGDALGSEGLASGVSGSGLPGLGWRGAGSWRSAMNLGKQTRCVFAVFSK